jgi:DNA-binding GntR family transcriptional regulator
MTLAVAALASRPRIDELRRRSLARELRLIFDPMADPGQFHAPFVRRNRVIAESITLGPGEAAEKELLGHLTDAGRQILAVCHAPELAVGR